MSGDDLIEVRRDIQRLMQVFRQDTEVGFLAMHDFVQGHGAEDATLKEIEHVHMVTSKMTFCGFWTGVRLKSSRLPCGA